MRTAIALALLGLIVTQVHAQPTPADAHLSGVPMAIAKRPIATPIIGAGASEVAKSGLPMSVAKRPIAAPTVGVAASEVAKSGVPMRIATQTRHLSRLSPAAVTEAKASPK